MSTETLKAALLDGSNLPLHAWYAAGNYDKTKADILALVAQERKEAVVEYANNESRFNSCVSSVPSVDPQKQRLDEFTRAILAGMYACNPDWIKDGAAWYAGHAKERARAQMAENDKP